MAKRQAKDEITKQQCLDAVCIFLTVCVLLICVVSFFVNLKVLVITRDFSCLLLAGALLVFGSASIYAMLFCIKDLWRSV